MLHTSLADYRREKNMTQRELAELVDVRRETIMRRDDTIPRYVLPWISQRFSGLPWRTCSLSRMTEGCCAEPWQRLSRKGRTGQRPPYDFI